MPEILGIDEFLASPGPILDVRSPAEHARGHIPGSVGFALFDDEERANVGRRYTQVGHEEAVELGFEYAGPKCAAFVRRARGLAYRGDVRVHCWRGGMRSQSMAWVLATAGLSVRVLDGGYKAYRRWVRRTLASPRPLVVLGGMTGTAKTQLLQHLAADGEAVIDLEGVANHRGSTFGGLMMPPQPSTEHFENLLAERWATFADRDVVWIEAESRRVGNCYVPDELFSHMEAAPAVEVVRSKDERIDWLVSQYGEAATADLVAATRRIHKRLGGQRTRAAVEAIERGDLREACAIILEYYDRTYRYDLEKRGASLSTIDLTGLPFEQGARALRANVVSAAPALRVRARSGT